jgi:WD40 repeat protein
MIPAVWYDFTPKSSADNRWHVHGHRTRPRSLLPVRTGWWRFVRSPHPAQLITGDASTFKSTQTYNVGSDIQSQQNGVVYANPNTIVSVSLSGVLNVFDTRESSGSKWRTLHGPTKAVTASALSESTFYAGSFDGSMKSFSMGSGEGEGKCSAVGGTGHSGQVSGLVSDGQGKVWSAGWDDKVASIEGDSFS